MQPAVLCIVLLLLVSWSSLAVAAEPRGGSLPPATIRTAPYPRTTTPDLLLENFSRAIMERNIDEYERLLHDEFTFHFAPGRRPPAHSGGVWNRAEELDSMHKMFSGQPGWTWEGKPQAPITSLRFQMTPNDDWSRSPTVPGGSTRGYRAQLTAERGCGDTTFVDRFQEFTVVPVYSEHDLGQPTYALFQWRELGVAGPSESWRRHVRARF